MPETIARVDVILKWLKKLGLPPVMLLVVPGKKWTPKQIDHLHNLSDQGHALAAHGWYHTTRPRKLYHRLHSALLSRDVAEHLDLKSEEILELMIRSREWFIQHGLPTPKVYVPPAWALGCISKQALKQTRYRWVETTRGMIQPASGNKYPLPLTGYEADTALREFILRRWNHYQENSAHKKGAILRISIHPNDLNLRINDQLDAQLRRVETFVECLDQITEI